MSYEPSAVSFSIRVFYEPQHTPDTRFPSGGMTRQWLLRWRFRWRARGRRVRREHRLLLPVPHLTQFLIRCTLACSYRYSSFCIAVLVWGQPPLRLRSGQALGCPAGSKTRQFLSRKPKFKARRAALDGQPRACPERSRRGGCPHTLISTTWRLLPAACF